MRVPVSWLAEHLELPEEEATAERFADALVRVGIEIEGVHELNQVTGPLVFARVAEIEELTEFKKPIRYCRVEISDDDESCGIVCGATNFVEGDFVVVALPGAVLPGGFEITARKTYGRISEGMICSARELGLGDDHAGILVLPPDTAEAGDDAIEGLGLRDTVLDVEPTPDRGYCLSVRGLARELACALEVPFGDPAALDVPEPEGDAWPARVEDPDGCPRFVLRRVSGLDAGAPTPWWMRRRLMLAGMRSISLAVDVTNYVMLELGHPLHAFDVGSLRGELVVRRANEGDELTTLDGVRRTLDPDDVIICDDSGPISIAGTMGGESTEISESSTDILLEAAHWHPASISRTARRHHLFSEAAKRFERFVDPALPPAALELAARLLRQHGDGTIHPGRTDVGEVPETEPVVMRIDQPDRVAGIYYARGVTARRLNQVGCRIQVGTGETGVAEVTATPPSWRNDLRQPADLVEEVLRLEGYDTIPSLLPSASPGRGLSARQSRRRAVCRALAEAGYVEVLPFPFTGKETWDAFGLPEDDPRRNTAKLLNPIESDRDELVTTLLPGLLDAMQRNIARGMRDVGLFHLGQVVLADGEQQVPEVGVAKRPGDEELATLYSAVANQPEHIGVVLTGNRHRSGWWGKGEPAGWADAIQAARTVAAACGEELTVRAAEMPPWHPGRCAELLVDGQPVGYAGELHPKTIEALGLPKRTAAMELDLDAMPVRQRYAKPVISAYPPVLQDVALVVDAAVPAGEVAEVLRSGAGELLEDLSLFDVYTGEQVDEGKRSLAYSLRFRAPDRTLTEDEATAARDAAVAAAGEKFGAKLRS